MSAYDPEELYQESTPDDIRKWLEACEENVEVGVTRGGTGFSERERDFLDSVRTQFDERVAQGRNKPLTGKQLAWLRSLYDKT
jgi:hypothetical protein